MALISAVREQNRGFRSRARHPGERYPERYQPRREAAIYIALSIFRNSADRKVGIQYFEV